MTDLRPQPRIQGVPLLVSYQYIIKDACKSGPTEIYCPQPNAAPNVQDSVRVMDWGKVEPVLKRELAKLVLECCFGQRTVRIAAFQEPSYLVGRALPVEGPSQTTIQR